MTKRKIMEALGLQEETMTHATKVLCEELLQAFRKFLDLQATADHLKSLAETDDLDKLLNEVSSPALRNLVTAELRN